MNVGADSCVLTTKITLFLTNPSSGEGEIEQRVIGTAVVEVWEQGKKEKEVLEVCSPF